MKSHFVSGPVQPASTSRLLALVIGCCALGQIVAQAGVLAALEDPPNRPGSVASYWENDAVSGEDRDYSNGLRLAYVSRGSRAEEARFARMMIPTFGLRAGREITYHHGLSLTQLMFHPDFRDSPTQPLDERRYAGWLALGLSVHAATPSTLNSLEIHVGTTGPRSFAEDTQNAYHDVLGQPRFRGWADQVPNEVTGDVSFTQKLRSVVVPVGALSLDGMGQWGVRAGTFRTDAHIEASGRVGYNLQPEFYHARISSAGDYVPVSSAPLVRSLSVYALVGGTARAVLHDATLDGPLFSDFETDNTREPLSGDAFVGLVVSRRWLDVSYVHTWRTVEYTEQVAGGSFGTVSVRVRF